MHEVSKINDILWILWLDGRVKNIISKKKNVYSTAEFSSLLYGEFRFYIRSSQWSRIAIFYKWIIFIPPHRVWNFTLSEFAVVLIVSFSGQVWERLSLSRPSVSRGLWRSQGPAYLFFVSQGGRREAVRDFFLCVYVALNDNIYPMVTQEIRMRLTVWAVCHAWSRPAWISTHLHISARYGYRWKCPFRESLCSQRCGVWYIFCETASMLHFSRGLSLVLLYHSRWARDLVGRAQWPCARNYLQISDGNPYPCLYCLLCLSSHTLTSMLHLRRFPFWLPMHSALPILRTLRSTCLGCARDFCLL